MREILPSTFRITGTRSLAESVLNCLERKYFAELWELEVEGERVEPPRPLPWWEEGRGEKFREILILCVCHGKIFIIMNYLNTIHVVLVLLKVVKGTAIIGVKTGVLYGTVYITVHVHMWMCILYMLLQVPQPPGVACEPEQEVHPEVSPALQVSLLPCKRKRAGELDARAHRAAKDIHMCLLQQC